jgi:endoglucanase
MSLVTTASTTIAMTPQAKQQPGLSYSGRFDFSDPLGPRFAWAGCTISLRFHGSQVRLQMQSSGENAFQIRIDGIVRLPRLVVHGNIDLLLASDLSFEEHTLELIKLTECFIGSSQLLGLQLLDGELLPPPSPQSRRIEFMGDSITGGFGVMADQLTDYLPYTCDVTQAYSWLTAETLGYEPRISAWSGLGLVRNFDDSPLTWTERYPWVIPDLKEEPGSHLSWQAHVVVINLGTNDFSGGVVPDEQQYVDAYIQLIAQARSAHPDARIICCVGPILDDPALSILRSYVQQAVIGCQLDRVYHLEFNHQQTQHGYGVSFHPSALTHQLMARQLSGFIQGLMAAD